MDEPGGVNRGHRAAEIDADSPDLLRRQRALLANPLFQRPADDLRPLMAGGYPVDSRMVGVMVRTGRGMVQPIYEIVGRTIETDLSAPLEYDYVRQVTNAGELCAAIDRALERN